MPRAEIEAFWEQGKADLAGVPLRAEVSPEPRLEQRDFTVEQVRLLGVGERWFRCWLARPRYHPGRALPAILTAPGYAGNKQLPQNLVQRGYVVLVVFPRGQGESMAEWELPAGTTKLTLGLQDPREQYYRGAYLDILRGLDFLAQADGVDPGRLGVWGRSQGGAFTIAAAALDPRVRAAVAEEPFLGSFELLAQLETSPSNELRDWLAAHPEQRERALATLEYFDTRSLADAIRCPILMNLGLADQIVPAATIRPTFARVQSLKALVEYPGLAHEPCADFNRHAEGWLERYLSC